MQMPQPPPDGTKNAASSGSGSADSDSNRSECNGAAEVNSDGRGWWLWVVAVVLVWLSSGLLVHGFTGSLGKASQLGDSFGVISSLFSGLAFLGMLRAISLQRAQLRIQAEELRSQREDLKLQKEAMDQPRLVVFKRLLDNNSCWFVVNAGRGPALNVHVMEGTASESESEAGWECEGLQWRAGALYSAIEVGGERNLADFTKLAGAFVLLYADAEGRWYETVARWSKNRIRAVAEYTANRKIDAFKNSVSDGFVPEWKLLLDKRRRSSLRPWSKAP